MSKSIRKKLTIATETVRTLAGSELDGAAGGNLRGLLDKARPVVTPAISLSGIVCYGRSELCYRPDGQPIVHPDKK